MIGEGVGLIGTYLLTQTVSLPNIQLSSLPSLIISKRYDKLFHFFFSKTINKIVDKDSCQQLLEIKEYEFLDQEREMLKRSYDIQQFKDRIGILAQISNPQTKFHIIQPIVAKEPFRKIMLKRTKRIKKYQKKLQQIQEQVPITFQSKFLDTVDSISHVDQISYDSVEHNIFSDSLPSQNDGIQKMAKICARGISVLGQVNQILGELPKSFVIDFDDMDQDDIVCKYQKLSGKQSFKKKYVHDSNNFFSKKRVQSPPKLVNGHIKSFYSDSSSKQYSVQMQPKLYNHSNETRADQKIFGKKAAFINLGNQSISTQTKPKSSLYQASTFQQLDGNNKKYSASNVLTSVRLPKPNTTQFTAVRKRALQLLSQDTMGSPKSHKINKNPGVFSGGKKQK